jgi:hypothetical protein
MWHAWRRRRRKRKRRRRSSRNSHCVFVGKPERNTPTGRTRHRWKNNIKIGPKILQEVELDGKDWINLA